MLQPEIAVPLADTSLADARGEAIALRRERAELEAAHVVERGALDEIADERRGLREVLVDVATEEVQLAERGRHPHRAQERRQPLGDRGEPLWTEHPPPEHGRRARALGQAPHAHRPVDDRPRALEREPGRGGAERLDAQVDAGREAPVEAHLVLAETAPCLHGPEVEEAEIDGALDLPRLVSHQEDPGGVRRPQRDVQRWIRGVRPRSLQLPDEIGLALRPDIYRRHHMSSTSTPCFHG